MASLRQGSVLVSLPYNPSQVGRVRLFSCELNKGHFTPGSDRRARQGSLRQATMYAYSNKSDKIRAKVTEAHSVWIQN